ncbi:MAG: hypothetical protein MJZ23_04155 [Paludibacteraceae bacterium]|nr:hypothetical protein [Paludibacteraceae bacterium]
MNLTNIWNGIVQWFSDSRDRSRLVRDFNKTARNAFVTGTAPTILEASMVTGNKAYKHEMSAWMNTGFCIKALSGRTLSRDEMIFIGKIILANKTLVRQLVALGWDTLMVRDNNSHFGCQWKLIEHADMGGFLD